MNSSSVCVVVVTYNRLALLKQCIAALRAQTHPPSRILVVNNGSTDQTAEWLTGERDLWTISQENLGGSAGFHTGLGAAFEDGHDLFWCMDDDTIPQPDSLERLVSAFETEESSGEKPGWLCSLVRWTDGSLHLMNEPKLRPFLQWRGNFPQRRILPAQWCSFVSVLVTRQAVATVGLPLKSMFIWYDDVEFTARIAQAGFSGGLVMDSVVEHRTKLNYAAAVEDLNGQNIGRFRYAFRNEIVFLRTLHEGRPHAFIVQFVRLMCRRMSLLLQAGKLRYLGSALVQGVRGLWFDRQPDRPVLSGALAATALATSKQH